MVIYILIGIGCVAIVLPVVLLGFCGIKLYFAGKSDDMSLYPKSCTSMKAIFPIDFVSKVDDEKYSKAERLKMEGICYIVVAISCMILFLIVALLYFYVKSIEIFAVVILLSFFIVLTLPTYITLPILKNIVYKKDKSGF
jgi:hypothetical protein